MATSFFALPTFADETTYWLGPQTWVRDTKGPVIELGQAGAFDDTHILGPAVAREGDEYRMWYTGSRGKVAERLFRLGLATSRDGRSFCKYKGNPVYEFGDGQRSILTPTLLRDAAGNVLREEGRLRMWFAAADFDGSGKHTLHESTSRDGMVWTPPSPAQLDDVYAPTILLEDGVYHMWYTDVSADPWTFRHATSRDGRRWDVTPRPCVEIDQAWEKDRLFYPTVVKIDGVYLMWYGSYWRDHPQKTAIGFAVSMDGLKWRKNEHNPVLRPDSNRPWESHYATCQSVMRFSDGSWRIWYTTRKQPPHDNKYFAISTARWAGPEFETDDRSPVGKMPDPATDRTAFTRWQRATQRQLATMLGIPSSGVTVATETRVEPLPLDAEKRGELEHDGLVIEKWVFTSEPGSRVPALFYRKKDHPGRMPAIVLTYGHGGSKSQPAYQYMAQLFAKLGIAVLAIDPVGEEERNVKGELGTRAHDPQDVHEAAWLAGRPILGKLLWDTMRGVDFVLGRDDVDPERVGVAGNSLGGALAEWMAALDPRLRCAIVSGFAYDDAVVRYGKYCTRVPNKHMRQLCTWPQFMALSAPHCSILVMNGDADAIIDHDLDGTAWRGTRAHVAEAAKTYAALGNSTGITAWFEPGGGHRPYPAHKAAIDWLVEQLHPADWSSADVARLGSMNYGKWARQHGIVFEKLYGTPLHLEGATVVDMKIRPLSARELACLRDEELGSPIFTLDGWLRNIKEAAAEQPARETSPAAGTAADSHTARPTQ